MIAAGHLKLAHHTRCPLKAGGEKGTNLVGAGADALLRVLFVLRNQAIVAAFQPVEVSGCPELCWRNQSSEIIGESRATVACMSLPILVRLLKDFEVLLEFRNQLVAN